MRTKIDLLKLKIGMWIAFGSNKTITATGKMLAEEIKQRKCDHCGKSPYHYIDKKCCK